jgi:hypothetical protein
LIPNQSHHTDDTDEAELAVLNPLTGLETTAVHRVKNFEENSET